MLHSPLALLWMLPIGGLIVLMYILKLRRKDVVVSSTFLWRQVIRDVQANAPFQKLRRNLLLLLQLIIAALLVFALAGPFRRMSSLGGRSIVLVVDTSASMRATDVAPSRFEVARRKALDRVNDLRPGDMMMVVSASSRPETVTGFTNDREELRRAIDSLQPHDTATNMREAVKSAANLVASRDDGANGEIDLISDGGFDTQEGSETGPNGALQYTFTDINLGRTHVLFDPVGQGHENVGIIAVDFRRNLGREKTVQLLVVTHNYASKAEKFNQEIYADDSLIDAHEISLPPGAETTEPYDLPEPARPVRMRIRLDVKDDLAVDNEASLILKPRKTLKVLLVGADNVFLENALQVDPGVELSKTAAFTSGKGYDVVVFYDAAPAHLPEGNYLFLHCASDQAPVKVHGSQENVAPADWERDHPVLRYVDFGSDRFGAALKATTLEWGRELAVAESGSLIVTGEKAKMRSEFVGFSLLESMFPLRVAFPIFISNSVRWLGTGSDDSELGQIHTGDTITIPAPPGAGKLSVTRPDGSKREVVVGERGGAVFDQTDQAGIYTATGNNFSYMFAANLTSPTESDITPHPKLTLAENPTAVAGHPVTSNVELMRYLALLALIVLAVEWWAFHRRVYVN